MGGWGAVEQQVLKHVLGGGNSPRKFFGNRTGAVSIQNPYQIHTPLPHVRYLCAPLTHWLDHGQIMPRSHPGHAQTMRSHPDHAQVMPEMADCGGYMQHGWGDSWDAPPQDDLPGGFTRVSF